MAVGLTGSLSNTIGRVRSLIILEIISVCFGYVYTIESTTALYISRTVTGFIAGSNTTLGLVAISEMFPSAITGFSGLFLYIVMTSFILFSSLLKPILSTDQKLADNWRIILLAPSFVGLVRLALLLVLFRFGAYESPGYFFANFRGAQKTEELQKKLSRWFSNVYMKNCVESKTQKAIEDANQAERKQ